jgi:hypothetical protein
VWWPFPLPNPPFLSPTRPGLVFFYLIDMPVTSLPTGLSALTAVVGLDIEGTLIAGGIPDELSLMTKLEYVCWECDGLLI